MVKLFVSFVCKFLFGFTNQQIKSTKKPHNTTQCTFMKTLHRVGREKEKHRLHHQRVVERLGRRKQLCVETATYFADFRNCEYF